MISYTTISIPSDLREILDRIVEDDPQWRNRSELVRDILWTWVKHQTTYYERYGKKADAAVVEPPTG